MKKLIFFLAGASLLCLCLSASGQALSGDEVGRYRHEIDLCSRTVAGWQHQAYLQSAMIIAVICFGAAITVIQGLNKGWGKPVTLILGAAVTVFTGMSSKIIPDYRVLQGAIYEADNLIEKLNNDVDAMSRPGASLDDLQVAWIGDMTAFNGVKRGLLMQSDTALGPSAFLLPAVFAQATPSLTWYTRPPASNGTSLFCTGQGTDSSLANAHLRAKANAVNACLFQVTRTADAKADSMRRLINASGAEDRTTFTFDPGRKLFTYYVLLRISSDLRRF